MRDRLMMVWGWGWGCGRSSRHGYGHGVGNCCVSCRYGWVLFLVVCSRVSGLEFKSRFGVVVCFSSGYVVWVECLMIMMRRKNGMMDVQADSSRI